jgi:hypothetical protein
MGLRSVFRTFLLGDPIWLRKITTGPYFLADVHIECPDHRNPKLINYVSEIVSDSYEYVPVVYVTMQCMISP